MKVKVIASIPITVDTDEYESSYGYEITAEEIIGTVAERVTGRLGALAINGLTYPKLFEEYAEMGEVTVALDS